jgi:hypothetical protein
MKAIVIDTFGGLEVLRESEVGTPEPGPGQVRVRVRVAGVNPFDARPGPASFPRRCPRFSGLRSPAPSTPSARA